MFKVFQSVPKMITRAAFARQLALKPDKMILVDYPHQNMFKMPLNNSGFATVEYTLSGDVYVIHHSEVPKQFQGQGLGRVLAEKTLDHIKKNNKKARLECEFLVEYYQRNKSKYSKVVLE